MGKIYAELTDEICGWIEQQRLFFVATAPSNGGHVNCSPKGMDALRVTGSQEMAYLDLTGSGVETIAHLRDNGRIVIMMCAFEGPPKIMRFHGHGDVYGRETPEFGRYSLLFPDHLGARAIIRIRLDRISDSCGYGVPLYAFKGDRETLTAWSYKKGTDGLDQYRQQKNAESIDGLPGLSGDRSRG